MLVHAFATMVGLTSCLEECNDAVDYGRAAKFTAKVMFGKGQGTCAPLVRNFCGVGSGRTPRPLQAVQMHCLKMKLHSAFM